MIPFFKKIKFLKNIISFFKKELFFLKKRPKKQKNLKTKFKKIY